MSKKELDGLRTGAIEWLESMRVDDGSYGKYKLAAGVGPTLASSTYAARLRTICRDLDRLTDAERRNWVEWIRQQQDPATGWFDDGDLMPKKAYDALYNGPKAVARRLNATSDAIICLNAISDAKPLHPFPFFQEYLSSSQKLGGWLESRDWTTKEAGCDVVLLGQFVPLLSAETKDFLFDWLDARQDPETGFWGIAEGCPLQPAFTNAYHIFYLYYMYRRPILLQERVIDATLTLQRPDGHCGGPVSYAHESGSTCADLDLVHILVNLHMRTPYRTNDIKIALERLLAASLKCRNADGGFYDRADIPSFLPPTYLRLPEMRVAPGESSLFSTLFRLATVLECLYLLEPGILDESMWAITFEPGDKTGDYPCLFKP